MGIPKFYRWLSERYPLLNMSVTATDAPPEIDNLYLDMNGIIHNCTHGNDPNLKLTETEMVVRIFTYLDKLIQIVKPKKLVFMAIDGVAPRAKMNQQRARRFKSAEERKARELLDLMEGKEVDPETAFDSNCITPGTAFMARLGKHLRFFVRRKLSEDTTWQTPVVIFSGHDVPGEGEHKIMEHIRWQKLQPGYEPNQRHCMYGLDADLVMLSLVTHEPHFVLLREVVSFSGKNRGQPTREALDNPCAENFVFFQIGLLRECFEVEFTLAVGGTVPLELERVVDDFVLFCMLVGNDFLPALPTLDIAEGALNQLITIYKRLLPKLGGYLTHAGNLDHARLEVLLHELAALELEVLEERASDAEYMESKRMKRDRGGGGRGGGGGYSNGARAGGGNAAALLPDFLSAAEGGVAAADGVGDGIAGQVPSGLVPAPLPLPVAPLESLEDEAGGGEEAGPTMMSRQARSLFLNGGGPDALAAWKHRYYTEKLKLRSAAPAETRAVAEAYIAGLHWVLEYYYRGWPRGTGTTPTTTHHGV